MKGQTSNPQKPTKPQVANYLKNPRMIGQASNSQQPTKPQVVNSPKEVKIKNSELKTRSKLINKAQKRHPSNKDSIFFSVIFLLYTLLTHSPNKNYTTKYL